METLQRFLQQARETWEGFGRTQKMAVAGGGAAVILIAILILVFVSRTEYEVLFSNLEQQDATNIVQKLKEQDVPYRVNGGTIEVPSDKVHELRLTMSSQGLPESGGVGFEIFDKASFGATEFTQKIQYRRALEGELSRTIAQLNEVQSARVHVVTPEPSLFLEKQRDPSASVVLKLKTNSRPSEEQVQGIVHLVASAIEGMKAEKITVIDTDGNVLSSPEEKDRDSMNAKATLDQLETKKAYEGQVEEGVQEIIGKVFGIDKAVVKVAADLNFSQRQTDGENYDPDSQVARSERSTTERFSGESNAPAGAAGTPSNIPQYQALSGQGNNRYNKNDTVTNYEISKTVFREIKPPGDLKRLSVAVLLDEGAAATAPSNQEIQQVVAAAAGVDTARGDQVIVQRAPFSTELEDQQEKEMQAEQRRELYNLIGKIALALVLIGFAVFLVRRLLQPELIMEQPGLIPLTAGPGIPMRMEGALPGVSSEERQREEALAVQEFPVLKHSKTPEEIRRTALYEEIEKISKEKPEEVAKILERWMSE